MTVFIVISAMEAVLAYSMYCASHYILCGIFILSTILSLLLSLAYEGKQLNRVKRLEDEIKALKK